jgi:hypothetical protein
MIYIRHGWDGMIDKTLAAAYRHTPDHEKYDGVAMIFLINAWVVAHEIGHLIGCRMAPVLCAWNTYQASSGGCGLTRMDCISHC